MSEGFDYLLAAFIAFAMAVIAIVVAGGAVATGGYIVVRVARWLWGY